MDTYDGPATVIAGGEEYEVTASLEITTDHVPVRGGQPLRGLREWHGTLHARDDDAAWNIHQADEPRLRVEGGTREGQFIVTNTQVGENELVIQGSGPAPFGD